MALLDRFAREAGDDRIPVHQFAAGVHGWARGSLTRAQVVAAFELSVTDEIQLDAVKAVYDLKPTSLAQLEYILWLERVLMLFEQGRLNAAQVAGFLEL